MKATKKQIEEVTAIANEMDFSTDLAIKTLQNCSLSIYKAIGARGVVESSIRANSKHFVDTLELAKKANSRPKERRFIYIFTDYLQNQQKKPIYKL